MYYDSEAKTNYIKRFNIETSTMDKEFIFIGDGGASKLLLITLHEDAIFKFSYHSANGQKRTKEIQVNDFVAFKGWKSIGNKVPPYKRMSAYEVIAKEIDQNNEDEVNSADIDIDNNDSDTLNLFE